MIEGAGRRSYKIERLKELIKQDSEVNASGFVEFDDPTFFAGFKHHNQVKRFLVDYFDESYAKRFEEEGVVVLEQILKDLLN